MNGTAASPVLSVGLLAARISTWLDATIGPLTASARELSWERIGKIAEEYGEVTEAWLGCAGTNPRKGQTHTVDDVLTELLDVALCALGSFEHLTGNRGCSEAALLAHAIQRTARAGLMPDNTEVGS